MKEMLLAVVLLGVMSGTGMEQEAAAAGPAAGMKIVGEPSVYTPVGFKPFANATTRLEDVSGFQVDREGNTWDSDMLLNTRFSVGMDYDSGIVWDFFKFKMNYRHDLYSGVISGGGDDLQGVGMPGTEGYEEHSLSKAYAQASLGYFLTLGGGFTTSHWGLGLLANDGYHGWTPGSAYFGDPRGGDKVLRAMVATGPWTSEKLTLFFAMDQVQSDDVLLEGDEASQMVAGFKIGTMDTYEAGYYTVFRKQEALDGDVTDVNVHDVYAACEIDLNDAISMRTSLEGALIHGETELASSSYFPEHDILQMAGAARVEVFTDSYGGVLDFLYVSGDANYDDDSVNNFRVDVNYEMGLLLYRQVLAAQSARTPFYASDLNLVGEPAEDLNRIPTRGNITNTMAIFPRAWYRPIDGLEVYGGPLIALSDVVYSDPFNSRIEGGVPHNALNVEPGGYYGTEFDLGTRWTGIFWGAEVQIGLEGGYFVPGSALSFAKPDTEMGNVWGWRFITSTTL